MKKYIKPSEYAEMMSITKKTVYIHFHEGKIKGYQDENTGTIYIENPEYYQSGDDDNITRVVLYARTSSSQNKQLVTDQLNRLRKYATAKGYTIVKEIKEFGSGLNDERKQLVSLFDDDAFDIVIVEHKDRLTRFGFNYLEHLFNNKNQRVEVMNHVDSKDEDIIQDFTSIITFFCARIYGKRHSKRKSEQMIGDLNENVKDKYSSHISNQK